MTSTFPSAPDNILNDVVNGTAEKDLHPNLHNQLADAINAMQTASLPGGSLSGNYNVKAYGAVGDGTADDTAALQATINAAWAAQGVVFLPAGTYLVSSPLTVPGAAGATRGFGIVGAARDSVTIRSPDGGPDLAAILIVGTVDYANACVFRDFSVRSGSGHTTGHGLILRTHVSLVDNITVTDAPQDGIRMESPYANHQFTHLTNCTVWGGGRDSLFIDAGVTDTTIDRFVGGFFARRGIYHRGGNVKFLNCHPYCSVAAGAGTVCFYQDTGNLTQILGGQYESANIGIQLENVSDCLVRGANFYHYSGSPLTGCVLAHNSARVSVTDCQTYPVAGATPNQGIVFNVVNGGVIAQNQLHGYQVGVKVDGGSTNITVADNVILGSSFTSIWVTNATRSTIHDNMVDTNSITEAAPSNYNIFHDNQLNGVTLTVVGANSAARNNMP